ncbi:uncharacterized protein BDZ83DRAFT_213561 [Colletotrichum acutatum]|uniref:Uncharacterized protein n=1 Tax=Glomerella acutata TaxID=27357 RepID=A0AAD8UPZ8_GLOAC|nr:uncharacterized protein BDZ83DRAFT_213561 [Colletotrichum acutatum]KAK1727368.1 hypothetical protein BDZ83DRAFT_213561 [Colletotrichum acutatum]
MPAARSAKVSFLQQRVVPDLILISLLLLFCMRISTSRGSSRDRAMGERGCGAWRWRARKRTRIRDVELHCDKESADIRALASSPRADLQEPRCQGIEIRLPISERQRRGKARRGETRRKIQARQASCMCS